MQEDIKLNVVQQWLPSLPSKHLAPMDSLCHLG